MCVCFLLSLVFCGFFFPPAGGKKTQLYFSILKELTADSFVLARIQPCLALEVGEEVNSL